MAVHLSIGRIRSVLLAVPLAVPLAVSLVALGGLAQVYVVVIGGQAYPMTLFPGLEMKTAFYGEVARYAPSLPEIVLGLGGVAIAVLIVAVAVKFLRFLPETLADAAIDPHFGAAAEAAPDEK